jgi:hypothetical protein
VKVIIEENGTKKFVCEIVSGRRISKPGSVGDILTPNGVHLEVKGAVYKSHGLSITGRYRWGTLIGTGLEPKKYDRLILVGDGYEFTKGPFDFFDIDYNWAVEFCTPNRNRTLYDNMLLPYWNEIHITEDQLRRRYRI